MCEREVGMARYHNFGFGTIPECSTSVSIPKSWLTLGMCLMHNVNILNIY